MITMLTLKLGKIVNEEEQHQEIILNINPKTCKSAGQLLLFVWNFALLQNLENLLFPIQWVLEKNIK